MLAFLLLLALRVSNPTDLRGTVPIGRDTSIDATEVTIGDWLAYTKGQHFMSGLTSDERKRLNLPITGIAFEQAQAFCRWKENTINQDRPANRRIHISLPSADLYRRLIRNEDSLCRRKDCPPCAAFQLNDRSQPYDGPQDWVGFRFIVTLAPRLP